MHEFRDVRTSTQGIGLRARLVARARKRQVGHRRHHGHSDESRVAGGRESERQIASRGVSGERNPLHVPLDKALVACPHVVGGSRKWMFGSKPIVRDKGPRSRSRGDLPDQMAVRLGGAKVEPTTVQVEDRFAWPPTRRMYPQTRYAAEQVCVECHVAARRYSLDQRVVLCACVDSWSRALAGADHGAQGGGDLRVFGVERMNHDRRAQSASFVSARSNSRSRPAMSAL